MTGSIKGPTVTDETLEPCPFCGGDAHAQYVTGMASEMRVSCVQCKAEISRGRIPFDKTSEAVAKENAIAAWNTRTATNRASEEQGQGASLRETGSHAAHEARSDLRPTGFDPARLAAEWEENAASVRRIGADRDYQNYWRGYATALDSCARVLRARAL